MTDVTPHGAFHCPECDYCLFGVDAAPIALCPECGRRSSRQDLLRYRIRRERWRNLRKRLEERLLLVSAAVVCIPAAVVALAGGFAALSAVRTDVVEAMMFAMPVFMLLVMLGVLLWTRRYR